MIFNQSHKSHTQITYETNQRDGTEAWCQIDNEMKIAMIGARGQWSEYEARNHNKKKTQSPNQWCIENDYDQWAILRSHW